MKDQGMEIRTAKTGVKYVHHEAIKFDIGIYFEVRFPYLTGYVISFEKTILAIFGIPLSE